MSGIEIGLDQQLAGVVALGLGETEGVDNVVLDVVPAGEGIEVVGGGVVRQHHHQAGIVQQGQVHAGQQVAQNTAAGADELGLQFMAVHQVVLALFALAQELGQQEHLEGGGGGQLLVGVDGDRFSGFQIGEQQAQVAGGLGVIFFRDGANGLDIHGCFPP